MLAIVRFIVLGVLGLVGLYFLLAWGLMLTLITASVVGDKLRGRKFQA